MTTTVTLTTSCDAPSRARYIHKRCPLGRCHGCREAQRIYQAERQPPPAEPLIEGTADRPWTPMDWADRAACRGVDTRLFYSDSTTDCRNARQVCAGCPVRGECLEHAITNAEKGIWGGLSERQRARIRRQRRKRGSAA